MNKKILFLAIVLISTLSLVDGAIGAGYRGGAGAGGNDPFTPDSNIIMMPSQSLDEAEIEAILKMREEEKLARDVYLTLLEKWQLLIFSDIAASEQHHTDMIKQLIDKYGLNDPVVDDSVGAFTQPGFKELYDQLVAQGMKSITDALKVGATIEDLDIKDLNEELKITDNDDITTVFTNLKSGSYNHMKAFVGSLEAYGETYTPQFISQEEFDAILSQPKGSGYSHKSTNDTMLPGRIKHYNDMAEKSSFTFVPDLEVAQEDVGKTVELYAFLYLPAFDKWYIFDAPNHGREWSPGSEIAPFMEVTLTDDHVEFPLFTNPLDLSEAFGTVEIYYGYKPVDGEMTYSFTRLVFE